jgi:hypothetical protein
VAPGGNLAEQLVIVHARAMAASAVGPTARVTTAFTDAWNALIDQARRLPPDLHPGMWLTVHLDDVRCATMELLDGLYRHRGATVMGTGTWSRRPARA